MCLCSYVVKESSNVQNVQVSDTTDDDSSNTAKYNNKNTKL